MLKLDPVIEQEQVNMLPKAVDIEPKTVAIKADPDKVNLSRE